MINELLTTNESIDVRTVGIDMRAYVDLSKYWRKGLSLNAAYEELLMKGMKIDRRTLAAAKEGTLARSEYLTLVRLRDWARELSGNELLTIEDILVMKEDDSDDEN
ncbi:MAG: hypothetical protein HC763_28895 [Hydrococcus sp. CRU_1_1]|nr:hypothetical protein [Hydrococcus sp. CRU_1_1]